MKPSPKNRVRLARIVAVVADVLQVGIFPLFAEGFISPLNMVVDGVVCVLMVWLVGWHFVFLPSFLAEGLPIIDLVPTWTLAVLIATRKGASTVIDTEVKAPGREGLIKKANVS
jgi:hypothetical protein